MAMQQPNRFHIKQVSLIIKEGIDVFEIKLEVREVMKIYRYMKKRGDSKVSDKVRKLLNSYANCCGYADFDINENITIKDIGLID